MGCITVDVMPFVEKKRVWCLKHDRMIDGIGGYKFYSSGGAVKP
jgi:hypothetical protein